MFQINYSFTKDPDCIYDEDFETEHDVVQWLMNSVMFITVRDVKWI